MASKKDYDKVIKKKAKVSRVVNTVAASLSANPQARQQGIEGARQGATRRAQNSFDADAAKAAKRKGRKK